MKCVFETRFKLLYESIDELTRDQVWEQFDRMAPNPDLDFESFYQGMCAFRDLALRRYHLKSWEEYV